MEYTYYKSYFVRCSFYLLFTSIFVACQSDLETMPRLSSEMLLDVERMENVEILYSDSAMVKVRIEGPSMIRYLEKSDPRSEFTEGVNVTFYSDRGEAVSTLSAKYAIHHELVGKVVAKDSVVWKSQTGEQIESEELVWEEAKEKIYTNQFVTITRPDEILYGYGFEAAQDFSYTKINAIEGRIKINTQE